ncbi:cell wall-binding repeat-containing protein [Dactylosporangium sp. NPDC005555]|uniref:cell wall-binding repeat-containing protein n=1 Tax=Dactylosporangium sp. NPDC005555 TaxID=3154889 RepID=UPI0033B8DA8B
MSSFGFSRRAALRGAVAAGVATATVATAAQRAQATLPGSKGRITYRIGTDIWIAEADGSSPRVLVANSPADTGRGSWAPDGSRFFYGNGRRRPESIRADGTGRYEFPWTRGGEISDLAVSADGRYLYHAAGRKLSYAGTDGTWMQSVPVYDRPMDGPIDQSPAVSVDDVVVFTSAVTDWLSDIYRVDGQRSVTKIITNGREPDFSPDTTKLVFSRYDAERNSWHVWLASADGTNQRQLTTAGVQNRGPVFSPHGDLVLFSSGTGIKRIDIATGQVTDVPGTQNASSPTWQPVLTNYVTRVWGATALGTAVATSRYSYATHGAGPIDPRWPAKAVVLSRDDTYLDALGGSALAVQKEGPLLITPTRSLDPQTKAEIDRLLGGSGTVYLLGGLVALSAKVEQQLTSAGYATVRLAGRDEYETAIAIAREMTPNPDTVIVTTALKYYDALAAGAAAGASRDTVIVLSAGDTMPASTAAYLNGIDPTQQAVVGVGGPGCRAIENAYARKQLPSWRSRPYWPVSGATEFETAVAVAEFFFTSPHVAAVATATTWYDALTGGAMAGWYGGPLLLSTPGSLSPQTEAYLNRCAASVRWPTLLGGPLALKQSLVEPLGEAVSAPGQSVYLESTETWEPFQAARSSLRRVDPPPRLNNTRPVPPSDGAV